MNQILKKKTSLTKLMWISIEKVNLLSTAPIGKNNRGWFESTPFDVNTTKVEATSNTLP